MKRRLGSGRISPPVGFEPATLWSEVGSANRSATRTLLVYNVYDIQPLLQFQILIYIDQWFSNPAVVIMKTSIKVENSRWNARWLPAIEMALYDFLFLFCAYNPVFDYFYVCKDNKSLQKEQQHFNLTIKHLQEHIKIWHPMVTT